MKKTLLLPLFLLALCSAHAQQLISNPTFQGTAQSALDMGGYAITNLATNSFPSLALPADVAYVDHANSFNMVQAFTKGTAIPASTNGAFAEPPSAALFFPMGGGYADFAIYHDNADNLVIDGQYGGAGNGIKIENGDGVGIAINDADQFQFLASVAGSVHYAQGVTQYYQGNGGYDEFGIACATNGHVFYIDGSPANGGGGDGLNNAILLRNYYGTTLAITTNNQVSVTQGPIVCGTNSGLIVTASSALYINPTVTGFYVEGNQNSYIYSGAPTNSRIWDQVIYDASGTLHYRMVKDDESAANDWMTVTRSNYASSTVSFPTAKVYVGIGSGSDDGTGDAVQVTNGISINEGGGNGLVISGQAQLFVDGSGNVNLGTYEASDNPMFVYNGDGVGMYIEGDDMIHLSGGNVIVNSGVNDGIHALQVNGSAIFRNALSITNAGGGQNTLLSTNLTTSITNNLPTAPGTLATTATNSIPVTALGTGGASTGQVLTYNGTNAAWATSTSGTNAWTLHEQVFTASGTFTVPSGVTGVSVIVTGAGGGGTTVSGSGGGAGGTAIKSVASLTGGQTVTVTVGAGGAPASSGAAGTGGNSSFGSYCTGSGGAGGTSGAGQNGGAGGSASGGDLNVTGGAGMYSYTAVNWPGGSGYWGGTGSYGSGGTASTGSGGIVVVQWIAP